MREIKATGFEIKVVEQSLEQPLKPCYKDQTPSNRGDALMLTAFSAGLTERDDAEVQALHMSWFARLVNRSKYHVGETSKRPYTRGREHFHT